jgi:ferritin-like metal-binding protein YciE
MERRFLEKWLRDAYAMEKSAIEILEKQVRRLSDFPMVQSKISEHLEQTRWQAQQIETCLTNFGIKPSLLKDDVARFSGMIGMVKNAVEDEIIKDLIADAAFENMEVSFYRSLITAAQECNEHEIRMTCEEILEQELIMAQWCDANIVAITQEFISAHAVAK